MLSSKITMVRIILALFKGMEPNQRNRIQLYILLCKIGDVSKIMICLASSTASRHVRRIHASMTSNPGGSNHLSTVNTLGNVTIYVIRFYLVRVSGCQYCARCRPAGGCLLEPLRWREQPKLGCSNLGILVRIKHRNLHYIS